jgi:glycine hydroxymethyltransferase
MQPAALHCGGSAYPRDWEYAKFREIADKVGACTAVDSP